MTTHIDEPAPRICAARWCSLPATHIARWEGEDRSRDVGWCRWCIRAQTGYLRLLVEALQTPLSITHGTVAVQYAPTPLTGVSGREEEETA